MTEEASLTRLREAVVRDGRPDPPGATPEPGGVNFSIFSPHATSMRLLLFGNASEAAPVRTIELEGARHRSGRIWHVFVEGIGPGTHYAWSVPNRRQIPRVLLDPWAREVSSGSWDRRRAIEGPAGWNGFRGRVVAEAYNWEDDRPVRHAPEDTILYELHVGSLTRHQSAGVRAPGTFEGVIEKIPYLESLGVTDVELMPIMAFDTQDVPLRTWERGLTNLWGYSPYAFFAPHPDYEAGEDPASGFRDMVKALHRAGIGVILDVVFNHTAEGDQDGPVIHFRELANEVFYHLDPSEPGRYRNYTGCGNTLNANHPVVRDFIVSCLEYWVEIMHVDGFRFDLASVLTRGEDGEPVPRAPVLEAIEASSVLGDTRLIAEAWDAYGLYQLGDFSGVRWMEWNGRYRDAIRRAVRGDGGTIRELAMRVSGSSDLYEANGKRPTNSVNYVTCHDGFTLWDLVSYNAKHNRANGEGGRDGSDANFSWNCGWEGETDDQGVLGLRRRQVRNLIAILFLSQGVPMLLAGDEFLRTQQGNNNAWCQDSGLSWLDWTMARRNSDMLRFVREMIRLRRRHSSIRRAGFLTGRPGTGRAGQPDVVWYGDTLHEPRWDDDEGRLLRWTLAGQGPGEGDLHVALNLSDQPQRVIVPAAIDQRWYMAVNTASDSPGDVIGPEVQLPVEPGDRWVESRSVLVLESR